jgi:hypothetical protein
VPQVFGAPLTERKASVIQELEAREEKLRERIVELQRQVREREDAERRVAKLANHSQALARIEDLLAKRITHYLLWCSIYSPEIVEAVDGGVPYLERSNYSDRVTVEGTKLLVLFGNSNGDLQWKVNEYRDGSGSSWTRVEPFLSRGAALARLQEIIDAFVSESDWTQSRLYDAAVKYGLRVPEGLEELIAGRKASAAASEVAEARQKLEAAEAKLRAARGEA